MSREGQEKIYQLVTDRIVALLEQGVAPWRKPWSTGAGDGLPVNLKSKKPYRGINVMLLALQGYASRYWATMKQINEHGGKVRAGEKGTPVIFWKRLEVQDRASADPEAKRAVFLLRYYYVWNLCQTEGLHDPDEGKTPAAVPGFEPLGAAQGLADCYFSSQGIQLSHGGDVAAYNPRRDSIAMPPRESFDTPGDYYCALFHEATHSTGHSTRLARPGVVDDVSYRSEKYGHEELVAELGAAFLCAETGIETTEESSAAYIQGWLQVIKGEPRMVVMAAAQAQKAADLIRGDQGEEGEQ